MAINKNRQRRVYTCSWCKKILPGHPMCFDIKRYTGSYRGYQPIYHFYFCTKCYNKIANLIRENKIKPEKVIKINSER